MTHAQTRCRRKSFPQAKIFLDEGADRNGKLDKLASLAEHYKKGVRRLAALKGRDQLRLMGRVFPITMATDTSRRVMH
jgi:hypothetical protein